MCCPPGIEREKTAPACFLKSSQPGGKDKNHLFSGRDCHLITLTWHLFSGPSQSKRGLRRASPLSFFCFLKKDCYFLELTDYLGIGSPLLLIKNKVAFLLQQTVMILILNLKLKWEEKWTDIGYKILRALWFNQYFYPLGHTVWAY